MQDNKYVYMFEEGNASMRNLLGGKGANLAEMTKLGLPVPGGFVVTTTASLQYYEDNEKINEQMTSQILNAVSKMERDSGKGFGNSENPLLVAIRSGARVSMPGMMDTVLNLGLNDKTVEGFAKVANERLAYDSYRRFIQMYANVVKGLGSEHFEKALTQKKKSLNVKSDTDLTADNLKELVSEYKSIYKELIGEPISQDVKKLLIDCVQAVFASWQNPRAIVYRRLNDIPSNWGTAVNVQAMVFGNKNNNSGTGVAFTRNPSTGEKALYGEYLINAQGEDVVVGIRTPKPMSSLKEQYPEIYKEFENYCNVLEEHYKDMQDMEFTIDDGKLYMLQTRNGKRTGKAAVKVAVDLVKEGLLNEKQALLKVSPNQLDSLLHPQFDKQAIKEANVMAKGLPASPGAGSGKIVLDSKKAVELNEEGINTILIREETSPEDIEGMHASEGVLTVRGGMTSHAAVVARGMGLACVAGCSDVHINLSKNTLKIKDKEYKEGDYISIDGATGNVYDGLIKTKEVEPEEDFKLIMKWATENKTLGVRTNADTPKDATQALKFGAEGIGLVRTEHMFFEGSRITSVRKMILADNKEQREDALEELRPMQRADFTNIYKVMKGHPVTIRFLDPPLHEFLPHNLDDIKLLAKQMNVEYESLNKKIKSLKELNPMLGHRGVRLSVTYPEIAKMQTTAVIEAAVEVKEQEGLNINPEIMIPLVCDKKELDYIKKVVEDTANDIIKESGVNLNYKVGTMIEVPRAALLADEIAQSAQFFSFGTNDLTQMTFGFSRDDSGGFLTEYYDKKLLDFDPFSKIDFEGVGKLIQMATKLGKSENANLKVGICGEHGGNPASVEFCHNAKLDYVSCSPYRVPIAILSAAHAKIKNEK